MAAFTANTLYVLAYDQSFFIGVSERSATRVLRKQTIILCCRQIELPGPSSYWLFYDPASSSFYHDGFKKDGIHSAFTRMTVIK